ncbi:uncharacterized protein [Lepeophtheirus salmonis]|uniref:Delta-like protein n=1 Tax=Lepeophtheirus salmonis TaxID=72036 RepID=A0A0K2TPB3_LEPSM|nr:delta-like protein B [Lepeophtheirus salmonis]
MKNMITNQSPIVFVLIFFTLQTLASHRPSQSIFELRLKNLIGAPDASPTKFRVCLKHFQQRIDPNDECTFGEQFTPALRQRSGGELHRMISFPLDFKWPGTFSLIIEAYHQNNKSSDSLISRVATQQWLQASSNWTQGQHSQNYTRLDYEYRVLCSSHYYGNDCDTLCRPRDDTFGHYICGSQGEKICLPGWEKDPSEPEWDYCTKAICLQGCHSEHGECSSPNECKCRTGWTGPLCDQCVRYPGCEHGYCNKPHECICYDGWGGLFCKNDLNYCTNHEPCRNGATCYNTGQGSYTCNCPPGFTGINCETRITNECSHQPCLNGGTCQGKGSSNYTCVCPVGFHGDHCEKRAQTCHDSPCQNNGACTNGPQGYICGCPHGFSGINCEIKLDACRADAPCLNNGKCIPVGEFYRCECPLGFTGPNCEENVDDCSSSPCRNSGTCIDLISDFKCYCPPGFTGLQCEINVNDCRRHPCFNGGTCRDGVNDFICTCPHGFTGRDCSIEINECLPNPCMNDGFCVDRMDDFRCHCPRGYSGKTCNILPDGTVLASPRSQDDDDSSHKALIGALSGIVPTIVIIGVLVVLCQKRRNRRDSEQIRVNADAARENELNSVNSYKKSKMLDDHMIVNSLDFPKQKRINTNIADEESFSAKDGSIVYKQMMRDDNKRLNSEYKKGGCSSENLLGYNESNNRMRENPLSSKFDRSTSTLCSGASSSNNSSSDTSSNKAKEYGLPTAASISAAASVVSTSSSTPSSVYVINERNNKPTSYIRGISEDLLATEV